MQAIERSSDYGGGGGVRLVNAQSRLDRKSGDAGGSKEAVRGKDLEVGGHSGAG